MTSRMVRLEKWGIKNASYLQFTIDGVVREHEYYSCLSVTDQYKQKMLLWKLHGAANPFISLLEMFKLYALPSVHIVSRQLIRYLAKCWKAFKGKKTMKDLKLQFYYGKFTNPQQVKIIENEQINKIMETMEPLDDQQLDQFAQQYYSLTLNSNKLLVEDCALFQRKIDKNLSDLLVFSQQQKMKNLQITCSRFRRLWNAQILYDRKRAFAYISTSNKLDPNKLDKSSQMMTLYDALQLDLKYSSPKAIISKQNMDKFASNLLRQLDSFEECNKEQWSYPLDIDNVFIEGRRGDDELMLGSNCELDIMQPFIKALGLSNQINTVENIVVFHSKPKPFCTSMTFAQTLREDFKIKQVLERNKIQLGIQWILLVDYMYESCLQPDGKSLLQTKSEKKAIVEALIGVDAACSFHPQVQMLIELIKSQSPEIQPPEDLLRKLTLQNIKIAYEDEQGSLQETFSQNRYDVIKNTIKLRVKIYFGKDEKDAEDAKDTKGTKDTLKYFLCNNKNIKSLDSNGKYIALYLLAHYALIETQRQFLELWAGQTVQVYKEKDPLFAAIITFIKIAPKIQAQVQKIDKSLAKWDAELGIRERMENMLEYCKTLKGRLFGSSCQNLTPQNQQQKLKQITITASQIKDHISYIFSLFRKDFAKEVDSETKLNCKRISSYLNGRMNICFANIFTNLDYKNYSDMFCKWRQIRGFKQSSQLTTKGAIKYQLDKIQNGLAQPFTKDNPSIRTYILD